MARFTQLSRGVLALPPQQDALRTELPLASETDLRDLKRIQNQLHRINETNGTGGLRSLISQLDATIKRVASV